MKINKVVQRPIIRKTTLARIYESDLERLNYLLCYELKDVNKKLSEKLSITQADLIHFLIDKLENNLKC
jgi:hypothetical protein